MIDGCSFNQFLETPQGQLLVPAPSHRMVLPHETGSRDVLAMQNEVAQNLGLEVLGRNVPDLGRPVPPRAQHHLLLLVEVDRPH